MTNLSVSVPELNSLDELKKVFVFKNDNIKEKDLQNKNNIKLDFEGLSKSFYKNDGGNQFFLSNKNQQFLFYCLFSYYIFDLDSKNIDFQYNPSNKTVVLETKNNPKKTPQDLINKGIDFIFTRLSTHTNSACYTSSKNRIFYFNPDSSNELTYEKFFDNNKNYILTGDAATIPLVKPFSARINNTNILDFLADEENLDTPFVKEFIYHFGMDFYKNLIQAYQNFINGDYNQTSVSGIEKQILIPDEDQKEGYTSISPMFNHNIGFKTNELKFQKDKLLSTLDKEIGGTKSMNVSYSASLFGGILTSFKMDFPQPSLKNIDKIVFNINKNGVLKIYLDQSLSLSKLDNLEKDTKIPNKRKTNYENQIVNEIANQFQEYIIFITNNINDIENSITHEQWKTFLLKEMNKSEKIDFLNDVLYQCIFPAKERNHFTNNTKNKCVQAILG